MKPVIIKNSNHLRSRFQLRMRIRVGLLIILGLFSLTSLSYAEEIELLDNVQEPDSLDVPVILDDISTALVELDSLLYSADDIYYDVINEKIILTSNATMRYHSSNIKANEIIIDLANNQANTKGETWMQDGTQVLFGTDVSYDIATTNGVIHNGASRLEKGFYYGREIRKVSEDVYDIDHGYFTTCEIKDPNFFIYSGRMRLFYRDKIVAKPIIFFVNHFPILMLPFGTFSVKTERASGILVPEPGYNSVDGKFLENIALYYAYDDYAEVTTALDWRERTGWEARLESNYIRRYYFNGSLLARYQHRIDSPYSSRQEWYIRGRHHSDFIDRSTLDANLEFMSSRTIWESSDIIDERLMERVTSSIAYRRPFFSTTLSSGATYTEILTDNTKQLILPTLSFSLPSKPVYELFTRKETGFVDAWWSHFSYSYSFRAVHYGFITDPNPSLADILYKNTKDPEGNYINQHNAGIRHTLGLSYNRTFFNWMNFSQSLTGNEVWFDRDREGKILVRGHDYGTNTRLSAPLYGMASFPNFKIRTIRHIVTPSVGFNYSPDFTENQRFFSFSGISLNSSYRRRTINFGLDQKWSMKYHETLTDRDRALNDVLTLNSTISYDLEREGKAFSDINHFAGFRPGTISLPWFNFRYSTTGSARQDAYSFDILNWRISNTLSISGERPYYNYFPQEKNVFFTGAAFQPETRTEQIAEEDLRDTARDLSQLSQRYPWDLTFNHDYSRVTATNFSTSNLRSSLSFRLTYNWSINYNNYINLERNELISQSLSISRDMPCWKLLINWSKQGDYWNFRVMFYNIQLPETLRLRHTEYRRG
ncbi:MAG: hypothetical protein K0B81_01975 [Candidatus Cloacimonetes bacterium]|nr:hypothetical protein [Candidatus Cloacimonadota bacterium]